MRHYKLWNLNLHAKNAGKSLFGDLQTLTCSNQIHNHMWIPVCGRGYGIIVEGRNNRVCHRISMIDRSSSMLQTRLKFLRKFVYSKSFQTYLSRLFSACNALNNVHCLDESVNQKLWSQEVRVSKLKLHINCTAK